MSLTGYRNLDVLKARLLPADLGDDSAWDADLTAIGDGVAAEFDKATGRLLRYQADAIHETAADQESIVLPSYPVVVISELTLVTGEQSADIIGQVISTHRAAGIVRFGSAPGSEDQIIRVQSTGGYWCDDGEETLPAGATALPDDLLQAWFQQCRAVCEAENTFRQKGAAKADAKATGGLEKLALLPGVKRTLQLYIRMG